MKQSNEDLIRSHRNGDPDALGEIVKNNLGMVYKIAMRESSRLKISDLDDLVQVGQMAVLSSVEKYDFSKGYKFITYASTSIQRLIRRYVKNDTYGITIPATQIKGCSEKTERAKENARHIISLVDIGDLKSRELSPPEVCERSDEMWALDNAIKDLPVELQIPVQMRRLGFPFNKIGSACGITREIASDRVALAIGIMRSHVAA